MKILHPQPPELCSLCGMEVQDLEWVIEQEDGVTAHWRCIHGSEPTWEAPMMKQLELSL